MSEKLGTLVCFAMKEEAGPFRKLAVEKSHVHLLLTGIGRVNARRALEAELARQQPAAVLSCGFAGALTPSLMIGDVIYETEDEAFRQRLEIARARPAKIFCADRMAITATEKKKLRDESGADAVEMESAEIHAMCRERGIPCATVRAVSDRADEDLPLDFNQLAKADMSLDMAKLMRMVAGSPGKIGALLRLQKQAKLAAENLAKLLDRVTG